MADSFKCPKCGSTRVSIYHSTQTRYLYDGKEEIKREVIEVYEPYLIQCDKPECQYSIDLGHNPDDESFYVHDFVVTFVETDRDSFDGVRAEVMSGADAESVARARVAEVAAYYKEEHEKCSDGIAWKESLPGRYLEDEKEIARIISGWHPYFTVYVFEPNGKRIDIDADRSRD